MDGTYPHPHSAAAAAYYTPAPAPPGTAAGAQPQPGGMYRHQHQHQPQALQAHAGMPAATHGLAHGHNPTANAGAVGGGSGNAGGGTTVSIWAGDLDAYMDENFLRNAVAACGWGNDITRIKVVRDRFTGQHAGYGFLDAASREAAARVLQMGSGMPIPGSTRCWRLNMGRQGGGGSGVGAGAETNVYVGDLDQGVTEFQLMQAFRPRYASTRHAKVVCNEFGVSRGFGFVRFGDAADAARAVAEMQGYEFNHKPIRLSPANGARRSNSNSNNTPVSGVAAGGSNKRPRQALAADDPSNTTVFIGGTAPHVTEELLKREFAQYGEVAAVRVPANKTGFAFVRFRSRESAQHAMDEVARAVPGVFQALNPHKPVRLEWAAEQIAVRNNHPSYPPSQPNQSNHHPAPTPYRVEPVRVPMGGHQLVHHQYQPHHIPTPMMMPPPPVMANGATAVVVPSMDHTHSHHTHAHSLAHTHTHAIPHALTDSEPPSKKPAIDYNEDATANPNGNSNAAASNPDATDPSAGNSDNNTNSSTNPNNTSPSNSNLNNNNANDNPSTYAWLATPQLHPHKQSQHQ